MGSITIDVERGVLVREGGRGTHPLWMIHGYGDSSWSFVPLFDTALAGDFRLLAPDLPGFGASPPALERASIAGFADLVAELIERRTPEGRVGLVGHSIGSPIAVRVAQRLGPRVAGLFSVEGNLTEADMYFSGRSARFDEPDQVKSDLVAAIWKLAAARLDLRRYHSNLAFADAESLWRFGRDSVPAGRDTAFGSEYRQLACPALYYWSASSTPEVTQRYLRDEGIRHLEYLDSGHWPMVDMPEQTAAAMADFFRESAGLR
jgi:pimeloyl-ACP methyl ester carboxylesterase